MTGELPSRYDAIYTDHSRTELKKFARFLTIRGFNGYLIGGWACWFYHRGSQSVDIDVILPAPHIEQEISHFFTMNNYVRPPFSGDWRKEIRAADGRLVRIDWDLTNFNSVNRFLEDPEIVLPWSLLPDHCIDWDLGDESVIQVADRNLLFLLKSKAHRDRSFDLQRATDPTDIAYLTDKIGKDEYDLRELARFDLDEGLLWSLAEDLSCAHLIRDTLDSIGVRID